LDPNFNEEYQFAEKEVAAPGAVGGAGPALGAGFAGDDEEDGADIECTCCYGDYPFDEMVQCTEGHLFCRDCLRKYAEETVFGKGQTDLHCLDGSGCKALFPHNQLEKSLGTVTYNKIMDRLADIEVRQAGIEGLHQCPFCDYKAEINNPDDKVFKCQVCTDTGFDHALVCLPAHFLITPTPSL
jgi:TRIAD3 protein (E3 ubiquitin-protein ligase RNF216)